MTAWWGSGGSKARPAASAFGQWARSTLAQPKKEGKDEKPIRFRLARSGGTLFVQAVDKPCEAFSGEAECYERVTPAAAAPKAR